MWMILRFYIGHEDGRDPSLLNKFKNLLKRTKVKENLPCFHACEDLVNHVYDGHLLAIMMCELQVDNVDALGTAVSQCDLDEVIEKVCEKYFDLGKVNSMRKATGYDQIRKKDRNQLMAMQEIVAKDEELKHSWMVILAASGLNNYALEMLELSMSFRKEWGLEFKKIYLENSLVNMSGRKGGWIEVDRFQEHVVRVISDRWNSNGNFSSADYLRKVISPNAMSTKSVREKLREATTGRKPRQFKKSDRERGDVVIVAREVMAEEVFRFTPGRVQGHGREYKRSVDLLVEGTTKLMKEEVVCNFTRHSDLRMAKEVLLYSRVDWRADVDKIEEDDEIWTGIGGGRDDEFEGEGLDFDLLDECGGRSDDDGYADIDMDEDNDEDEKEDTF
ncbi:hypothetical protein BGX38DRAFT_1142196 [Terfezia claveryi]|nr:hypothetical protein BGX38DRAFT_1142196 [Terfezia claveryi]